jgi:hypothetical protein
MDSRYFGIMEGHGNFAFNLVGYIFLSLRLQIASMSSALLSVILVCNRKNIQTLQKIQQHVILIFTGMSGTLVTKIKQCVQH